MKARHIQHLYFRAGFGIETQTLESLSLKSRHEVVRQLIKDSSNVEHLRIDLSELEALMNLEYRQLKNRETTKSVKALVTKSQKKLINFNVAWIERLTTSNAVLAEKMTLFWANVFVCRDNNIWYMQRYNNLLRSNALGNFRDLVKEVAQSASMSKYLNNRQNVKESPNENFARELMELFTLGIGNYTENDIKEAARAFTGWSFRLNGDFFLRRFKHDNGEKQFFGKTGNFNGEDIIDIILEQKQCARFICEKLYRYFVNPVKDIDHVEELTNIFYADYDIKNLMEYLFTRGWFYEEKNIGAKIKSPIELLVGIHKVVPVAYHQKQQLIYLQKLMGQVLLYPPNVAGWKGDKSWIDPNTLMLRLKLASILLNDAIIDMDVKGELEDDFEDFYREKANRKRFIKTTKSWGIFDSKYEGVSFEALKDLLIIASVDKDTEHFMSSLEVSDKRAYCIQLMSIPEYQLC
ncbi:DUF1800 domain-containing protein [Snuella sedimenti]|uniref:DUF1800 domain-containing protein n=1 Tax=Snuella sedimenti TaxID=2798802 RepID=A0A8J7LN90_9FLAO|nr:DUF1800 domain-containing protein [Snuella sedimenti]MBJ6368499.1 DUF1800 domain-containing protein [Snuella sedimenti]